MAGKGNWSQRGPSGDLLVKISIRPHPYFQRKEQDIIVEKYITVTQAILGAQIETKTLTGKTLVTVKPGTIDGTKIILKNQGLHKLPPNQAQKGDHHITFRLSIPTKLTEHQREALEAYAKLEQKIVD